MCPATAPKGKVLALSRVSRRRALPSPLPGFAGLGLLL